MRITFLIFLYIFSSCNMFSQNYNQLVEQAINATNADSLRKAESLYRQALKTNPNDYRNALVYHNLGHVQEMMYWQNTSDTKMLEEAVYNYSQAIEMQPENIPMRYSRGNLNLNLKAYGKAILDYTAIIKKDPQNTTALNRRAYAYFQQRDYDKAKADYNEVLHIEPTDYLSQMGVALVLQKTNNTKEAINRMEFLIDEYPDKAELYTVRSQMYADQGMLELAVLDMSKAIELEPQNSDLLLQRADLYDKLKKHGLAKRDSRNARKIIE